MVPHILQYEVKAILVLGSCFSNLDSLELLDLSSNQIQSCISADFQGLSNSLSQLDLHSNQIDSLEEMAFTSLSKLKVLKLNNNAIRTVTVTQEFGSAFINDVTQI